MNSPQALAEYARSTDVWVCASETLGSRWPYKDMLDRDAMHVVMVDLCWTGGLTEGRKIAAMAETYHRPFAPHDCIGPVGFIAAVHMSFSQPNTLIQESVRAFYTGWYNELVTDMPVIKDGYVYPDGRPGLGVELLPAVFERSDLTVRRSAAFEDALRCPIDLFDLSGRTALVTGSSRGLGRAIAEGLASAGARLIVNGVDPGRVDAAVGDMRAAGLCRPTAPPST